MSGFEFTPAGIVPIGTWREGQVEGAIAGATADVPPPVQTSFALIPARPIAVAHRPEAPAATPVLTPKNIVRLAKARLQEIERDIKRLRKLEIERDELKRLLDAARKPLAIVRSLPTRSA